MCIYVILRGEVGSFARAALRERKNTSSFMYYIRARIYSRDGHAGGTTIIAVTDDPVSGAATMTLSIVFESAEGLLIQEFFVGFIVCDERLLHDDNDDDDDDSWVSYLEL